jgi:hypothetical protein
MTVFAKRRMGVAEWAPVQDKIGTLQLALNAPHDLMMFSVDSDERGKEDIFIVLPNDNMLKAFPGFETIERDSLPDYLCTLVVREDGFRERFPDIAKKRRTKFK